MSIGIGKIGIGIGGSGSGVALIITATVEPALQDLIDGETVGDIVNIATLRDTSNYSSTEGTISSAVIQVDGTPQANGFTLSTGEFVRVFVTDSAANTRSWTIDASVAAAVSNIARLMEDDTPRILEDNTPRILDAA